MPIVTSLATLTSGWFGLAMGYVAIAVPMFKALQRRDAVAAHWSKAVVSAAPLALGVAAAASVFGPVFPGTGPAGNSLLQFALRLGVGAGLGYLAGIGIAEGSGRSTDYRRGSIVRSEITRPRRAAEAARSAAVTLAGQRIPLLDETKHFKIIGTTGTGKSTAIQELLDGALCRGDRAIIADPDGAYLRRYFNAQRGDVVLNPFNPRSEKWDLYGEIAAGHDVDQLARSLIPDHEGADRSWRGYARTFLAAVIRQTHEQGIDDVGELNRLLLVAKSDELRKLLAGTPAQPFLEEHNSRMFDSVRSVTSSALSSLEYIAAQRAEPFSVRAWVNQHATRANPGAVAKNGSGGVLFVPYRASEIAALRSTVSAWMRLAIFESMNQPEGDQRLWFVVDELDALGNIDGLKDALARLRKFGGRCVLGFQSIGQVSSIYGDGEAQTIVENCANTLILRCSASERGGTSRFASQLIGNREVSRYTRTRSRHDTEVFGSTSESESISIEPAVMSSEIERLPDLHGLLKTASTADWRRVVLQLAKPVSDRARQASRDDSAVTTTSAATSAAARRCANSSRSWRRPGVAAKASRSTRHRLSSTPSVSPERD